MIWSAGEIVEAASLQIGVGDRTFENGLGLFETLRTWGGHAPLLQRHLNRLKASARSLGLPLVGVVFPDDRSIAQLLSSSSDGADARIRITLSGGTSATGGASLWMTSAPLSAPSKLLGSVIDFGFWEVLASDRLARHKSLNYLRRRQAYDAALERGLDEVLSHSHGERLWEGSRTNLFVIDGETLVTSTSDGPIVPGIWRGLVLEVADSLGWSIEKTRGLSIERLAQSTEVFLTNSVRGICPVSSCRDWIWPTSGEKTARIKAELSQWIETAVIRKEAL